MNIAAHHCIEPNAAIITHYYIAYNCGIWRYKTVIAKWGRFIMYR
jgi:hypothetical protein